MTIALRRANLPIMFLPECLTASYVEAEFGGLMEFTNRQIMITRVYSPKLWATGAASHLLFSLTLLLGVILAFYNLLSGRPAMQILALAFLPLLLAAIRAGVRVTVAQEALPGVKSQIQHQSWVHLIVGSTVIPFVYCANFAATAFGRTIRWRGIRYELISPQQTRILGP